MVNDSQNKTIASSETVPFNISNLSTLQYVKIIFIDTNNELLEIQTNVNNIDDDTIQLYIHRKEDFNITCPVGVALKLVTSDAIYFAKTVLIDITNIGKQTLFTLNTPSKTIRQQKRKFYRINIDCPCVILANNKDNNQTFIAQSVNISKGGILLHNVESMLSDESINLPIPTIDNYNIAIFLEKNLRIKLQAKFVRAESVNGSHRYAFQYSNMAQKYIVPFNKYIAKEEIKSLNSINNK